MNKKYIYNSHKDQSIYKIVFLEHVNLILSQISIKFLSASSKQSLLNPIDNVSHILLGRSLLRIVVVVHQNYDIAWDTYRGTN